MANTPLLEQCALFSGLRDAQVQLLMTLASRVSVERGAVLFKEGQPAKFLYVVELGTVALEMSVSRPDGSQTRPATVAILGPGEPLGWSAIVEPYRLTLSARAVEPSRLLQLEGETLRELLQRYRDVGYVVASNLAKLLAQRLAQTRQTLIFERGWAMV